MGYDDQVDVKGTLISEILHGIERQIPDPGLKAKVAEKAKELLGRISWSRAAVAIAKGALTFPACACGCDGLPAHHRRIRGISRVRRPCRGPSGLP